MQFRKTAVAVAIAGIAAGSPQIASADTVLSGVVEIQLAGSDDETADVDVNGTPVEAGDIGIQAGDALFGIVTAHTLSFGAEGYASLRVDSDGLSGNNFTSDNVYVGIRGGFGDFRFGEVPVAAEYGQLAGDLFDQTGDIDAGISYTGVFGPVVLGLNWSPEAVNNADSIGAGIRFNFAGLSFGVGVEERAENANASFGASYGIAGFSISGHFVTDENNDLDREIVAVKLGYAFQGLSFGLTYSEETIDLVGGGDNTEDLTRFDVGLGLGGGMTVSARFDSVSDGDDEYRVQLAKSF